MPEIATRWHKVLEAIAAGRVQVAIMNRSADALADFQSSDFDYPSFAALIEKMSGAPRFVIDAPVAQLVVTDQALMSVGDMMICGVLRLPYEFCVVEYASANIDYNVLLHEHVEKEGIHRWYGSALSLQGIGDSQLVTAFPCRICLDFKAPEEIFDTEYRAPQLPTMNYTVEAEHFVKDRPDLLKALDDAHYVVFRRCVAAFLSAVLLPQTIGLDHQEIRVKEKFNRDRASKGRGAIPHHTLIKLGALDPLRGGSRDTGGGGSVEVHLRRAHKRRVAVGEGRRGREWRFFPAQIVGYLPDGRKPTVPEMLATRAAKPYLIKL